GPGPRRATRVFAGLGIEERPLRRTREDNRCRLRAVVVFRLIQDFVSGVGSVLTGGPRRSIYEIDLSYQSEEIEELDSKGRAHRRNGDRNPDPYGLAQKLRGIGSFLDCRPETTLTGISVEDRWITVRYRTAEGRIEQAKQDVAYFYNYWV